ncbi:MAG: glycosyl transferase family 28 [Bacteroidetes bacterium]|nr:glycosyl transferase family 28 [Bacteroidota bacterium]
MAPLDWGLGHATRCIPIIYGLIAAGFEVIIAADGATKILLKSEFSHVDFTVVKGYEMQYSRHVWGFKLSLLAQMPKVWRRIRMEQRWLGKIITEKKIDLVISDNRLGLYHPSVPCIYITHQLHIETGNRFTAWLAQKMHYHFINRFTQCWVPDVQQTPFLAGILSHPHRLPRTPVRYIGPISRFEPLQTSTQHNLLVLLSGPEPQRSIFEQIILQQLIEYSGTVLLVRGLPGNTEQLRAGSNVTIKAHLDAKALSQAVQQSAMVVCRSGYTTIMDLVKLKQKAILVPTPGQTEQEYLADYLQQQGIFYSTAQKNFSLQKALREAEGFQYKTISVQESLPETIASLHTLLLGQEVNTPGSGTRG